MKVTSNCLSGKGWRFDPDTNTLILNGFNITSGGTFHQKINDGTTWLYSFIHVDDDVSMNLNIRLKGADKYHRLLCAVGQKRGVRGRRYL